MNLRLPIVLLSALAVAAPGAMATAKDKNKDKDKDKGRSEERSDRSGDRRSDDRDDDRHHGDDRGGKVTICHVPPGNRSARHTIRVGESAWSAHQGHGDYRGACRSRGTGDRAFDELDLDDDGRISAREWRGDQVTFGRLDRDDDGFLSRREFSRR
jgi:Ni/Co efflux regulator RcnB